MQPEHFYASLRMDTSLLQKLGFNPYYQHLRGLHHGHPFIAGRRYFDLASNDYLGLASDTRVKQAAAAAVEAFGTSMCGTPIATGNTETVAELEQELAAFIGLEAAVVFPSCYQANLALFPAIATERDLIIVDHYAHASLAYGIKAVGCKIKPFLHNDVEHLRKQLSGSNAYRQTFVVTESVFSTDGTIAPVSEIVQLCEEFGAIPVVDDSHGIGVMGQSGRGILEEEHISEFQGIYTASLGKALANAGGVIAGKNIFIEALRYSCPGLIYSTALVPACAAGVCAAIRAIEQDFGQKKEQLKRNHCRLLNVLSEKGAPCTEGGAPIAAIRCGTLEQTILLAKEFFSNGLLGTPFVPPSVPPGRGVLRLIVGAKLDDGGMDEMLRALKQVVIGGMR